MSKFKPQAVSQFWAIAKLYWLEGEKRPAIVLLLLMGILLLGNTQVKVFLNGIQGDLISALSSRDSNRFWQGIGVAFLGVILFGCLNSAYGYLREMINIYWRRWLTAHFLGKYPPSLFHFQLYIIERFPLYSRPILDRYEQAS